ncbi:MAG: superoxide dismutase [Planctomycetes bacterium]|nr:superoxide dismutase [Planctomycetota bacterium]
MRRSTLLTAIATGLATSILLTIGQPGAFAHCEVPCGIYDDHARIDQMLQDTTTIGKAVAQILELTGKTDAQSLNQLTRWINTKESHATRIQNTIAQYFLTQRVKPARQATQAFNDYIMRLVQHHAVMVAAMKTKQTVDPQRVAGLREAIEAIAVYYSASHSH